MSVKERRPGIFLSHSHADKALARKLATDLTASGARVWLDEAEIQLGDSLLEKFRSGIDEMDYLAVILSPNSVNSEWVKKEVDIAMNQEIDGRRVKVLPLLYRPCELPGFLKGKLYADFSSEEKYSDSLNLILKRLGLAERPPQAKSSEQNNKLYGLSTNTETIGKFIELAQTWQTSLQYHEQREIQIMLARLHEIERKQRLFGATEERQAQVWEILYNLDNYFFQRLGVSLLSKYS